jgi:hypothetical protein
MRVLRTDVFGGERLGHDAVIGEPPELMAPVDAADDLESVDPGRAEATEDLDGRAGRDQLIGELDVDVTPSRELGSRAAARADREGP